MNKLSLEKGRIKQKQQTREEILKAARSLMNRKKKITLEDVAEKASISRATIYRYFSNVELLFTEASLDIHHLAPDELLEHVHKMPLKNRLLYIQNYYNQLAQKHELGFRRYLISALTESIVSKKKVRGARRIETLKLALQPYKNEMTKKQFDNLIHASTLLMGIDALIVAKDVCGLSNEEANKVQKWALELILKGILDAKER